MKKEENDVIIEPKERKKAKMGPIIGMIFIVWFIGSIIAMMYFSSINAYYAIMIFGQYFLVFGMIPLINTKGKEKLIGVPFLLVGLGCIIIPYLMMHPELLSVNIVWDSVIPLIFILAFIIVGALMIIFPILNKQKLKKRCIVLVAATIIMYDSHMSNDTRVYSPIYEFIFNNKKYKVTSNFYSSNVVNMPGTVVELRINPDNPEEFLDESKSHLLIVGMGVLFLTFSIPILIDMLSSFEFVK